MLYPSRRVVLCGVSGVAILCFGQRRPRLHCSHSFLGWQKRVVQIAPAFLDAFHPPCRLLRKVFLHAALMVFPVFVHGGGCGVTHMRLRTYRSSSGLPRGPLCSSMVYPAGIQR